MLLLKFNNFIRSIAKMEWRSKRQSYSQSKENPFQNRTTLLRGTSFFKTIKPNSSSLFTQTKISQQLFDVENYFTTRAHSAKYTSMSSTCWSLYDESSNIQLGFRHFKQREVASLTKIMTTLIGLQLKEQHNIYSNMLVKITEGATKNIGTSAHLKRYHWICLKDLFYGIMLPSGNDAAHLLSEVMGYILVNLKKDESFNPSKLNLLDLTKESTVIYIAQFVKQMNLRADQLGLTMTRYSNPHGLQNGMNLSTAKDILTLSIAAAKNHKFRNVMNAQTHRYYLYRVEEAGTVREPKQWENTNILLAEGWQGIKTGQTNAAGGCLSSLKNGIFIVILNCPDSSTRFRETKRLYNWYIEQGKQLRSTLCSSTDSFQF